jgi:hypothetical protein
MLQEAPERLPFVIVPSDPDMGRIRSPRKPVGKPDASSGGMAVKAAGAPSSAKPAHR